MRYPGPHRAGSTTVWPRGNTSPVAPVSVFVLEQVANRWSERVVLRASVPAAIVLAFIAFASLHEPPPEKQWHYGVIAPGGYHNAGDLHRFRFRTMFTDAPNWMEVLYIGKLRDDVCPGQDTNLEGFQYGDLFFATALRGPGCIKGIECRRWACLPIEQRPPECHPTLYDYR